MSIKPATAVAHLYVHVPFCARKCAYCAFYSEASEAATITRWVDALGRELELVAHDLRPQTVFFGGGTPSLLNVRQWTTILRAMDRLGLLGAAEWTIECNPATVSLDQAKLWRDYGVNRLSLGVQSLDDSLLARLGRIHTRRQAWESFDLLRRAGFENLNLDLMFAIPGQTLEAWRATLGEALAWGNEHLSCYEVIYEEDTPLLAQLQAGEFRVDEDLACAMYEALLERAAADGFEQYEVSNFARRECHPSPESSSSRRQGVVPADVGPRGVSERGCPHPQQLEQDHRREKILHAHSSAAPVRFPPASVPAAGEDTRAPALWQHVFTSVATVSEVPLRACRHNVNCWRGGSYYGLGPSAAGYVGGIRTKNWSNTLRYCAEIEQGRRAIESQEELSPLQRAGEIAAFGLRMTVGWPFDEFQQITGYDLRAEWQEEIRQLVARDWAQADAGGFRLTPQGLRFADAAGAMFLR